MRHYEVVFLVHPKQSAQVPEMIQKYKSIIESSDGKIHRLEDWGLRPLAYPINKSSEAHYVLMNIECTHEARKEITAAFHFSDFILRNLILNREEPILEPSPITKAIEKAKANEEARKLKQGKEKNLPLGDNAAEAPLSKPSKKSTNEKQVSTEKTEKPTEDTVKQNESKRQKSEKDDTNTINDDAKDTSAESKDTEPTKE